MEHTTSVRGQVDTSARKKALEATFSQIRKQYGEGAIMHLGQQPSRDHNAISTRSLMVDHAIGTGGIPRGRITEIFGPEASGKSTIALQVIAEAQRNGLYGAIIDAEHALDPSYAAQLGININELIIAQPESGEQALEIAEMLTRSNAVDVIVIDSVAALVPKAEIDGEMGDTHVGLQARLMSQALRKLTPIVHRSGVALIFINQVRQNINAMAFANKEVTTGGVALKFYASLRIDVRRIQAIKDKQGAHIGNRLLIKIAKNKMAAPFKKVEVELFFGEGISREYDLIAAALVTGVIKQSGSWFSFEGEKIGQGKEQIAKTLKENPALFDSIMQAVRPLLETQQSLDLSSPQSGVEE